MRLALCFLFENYGNGKSLVMKKVGKALKYSILSSFCMAFYNTLKT